MCGRIYHSCIWIESKFILLDFDPFLVDFDWFRLILVDFYRFWLILSYIDNRQCWFYGPRRCRDFFSVLKICFSTMPSSSWVESSTRSSLMALSTRSTSIHVYFQKVWKQKFKNLYIWSKVNLYTPPWKMVIFFFRWAPNKVTIKMALKHVIITKKLWELVCWIVLGFLRYMKMFFEGNKS